MASFPGCAEAVIPARILVLIAAALSVLAGGGYTARALWRPAPPLDFAARADPPGFRDLAPTGNASRPGVAPLEPAAEAAQDLCAALFADPDAPRIGAGPTTAVYFTDYRCPYCRELGALLIARAAAGEITLIVKEWPILGTTSQTAAHVALAAARQGAYLPAYERLMGTAFDLTPARIAALARDLGLDPSRLAADIAGPAIPDQLARNAALARDLGLDGTPGLVIGRTIARRALREPLLDRLIAVEAALGPAPCGSAPGAAAP